MMKHHQILLPYFNQGDASAFTVIYELNFLPLFYFILKLVERRSEAEDITSDVFYKLWKRKGHFEDLGKIRTFLFKTARHQCFDFFKHEKIKLAREWEIIRVLNTAGEVFPEKEGITPELTRRVYVAIERLPDQCKNIFKLCYIEGLTTEETARLLGISIKTVYNQKVLAVARLRGALLK